ncbi:MAG: hypothetical protein MJ193_04770 [Clostridia bacterium]|nr:hypothetical protein [Clostridia bacterium]
MKKHILLIIATVVCALCITLSACNNKEQGKVTPTTDGDLQGRTVYEVDSAESLQNATKHDMAYISLVDDIESVNIVAIDDENPDFVIDLNGHKIDGNFTVATAEKILGWQQHNATIKAKVKNGEISSNSPTIYYAVNVVGSGVNITLNNVDASAYYGGLVTNGTFQGSTITALNCKFEGLNKNDDCLGAYLPAGYKYNFTDCEFSGDTGIGIKSGNATLYKCRVNATANYYTPAGYNGSGIDTDGNALSIQSTLGYNQALTLTATDCTFASLSGYAVSEGAYAAPGHENEPYGTATLKNCTLSGALGSVNSQNDNITIL